MEGLQSINGVVWKILTIKNYSFQRRRRRKKKKFLLLSIWIHFLSLSSVYRIQCQAIYNAFFFLLPIWNVNKWGGQFLSCVFLFVVAFAPFWILFSSPFPFLAVILFRMCEYFRIKPDKIAPFCCSHHILSISLLFAFCFSFIFILFFSSPGFFSLLWSSARNV